MYIPRGTGVAQHVKNNLGLKLKFKGLDLTRYSDKGYSLGEHGLLIYYKHQNTTCSLFLGDFMWIMYMYITTNFSLKSVVLESSFKPSLGCQFGSQDSSAAKTWFDRRFNNQCKLRNLL